MPQADPEDRYSVGGEGPYDPGSIGDCIGVTRPVRQKYSVRLFGQSCIGRRVGRNYSNPAIVLIEESQDVALDSVVVTREARSNPSIEGQASSAALLASSGSTPAPMTPRITPTDLKCRVRRRVSTS